MLLKKLTHIGKEVFGDPGFGLALSGTFLFAQTNPVGLTGCIAVTLATIGMKILRTIQPPFMQQDNHLTRTIKDSRTPLRLLGAALIIVAGTTLVQGLFMAKHMSWAGIILPAFASLAYATANFRFAAIISENQKEKTALSSETSRSFIKLILKRPETYLCAASAAIGIMTGGLLLCLPFLVCAYIIALKNVIQNRPPTTGHSGLYFSLMMCVLTCAAIASAQPFLAIGNALSAIFQARVEVLSTPGGAPQVIQDVKSDLRSLLQKILHKSEQPELPAGPR